jgi:epoxyqueuosine reductase QueG
MAHLSEHPTVKRFQERMNAANAKASPQKLDAGWLRELCIGAGADDVGFVEVDRPELSEQRAEIRSAFPHTKTLVSFVCRMNREDVRNPARSIANLEFHRTGDEVNEIARNIVAALEQRGIRALNPAMGFPMEMDRFGKGKAWVISHKPVAVAAGLGHMGIHRNVIHRSSGTLSFSAQFSWTRR